MIHARLFTIGYSMFAESREELLPGYFVVVSFLHTPLVDHPVYRDLLNINDEIPRICDLLGENFEKYYV